MKTFSRFHPVYAAVWLGTISSLSAGDTAVDLDVTGYLSATSNLFIDGNTASFGTEGLDAGYILNYIPGADTIEFNASSSAATWIWRQGPTTAYVPQMRLGSGSLLTLFRSDGATGLALNPASVSGSTNEFIKLNSPGNVDGTAQRIAAYSDVRNGYVDFKRFTAAGPSTGLVFGTFGGDVMVIRSNGAGDPGNVGIGTGTSVPAARLEVNGSVKISGAGSSLITPSVTLADGSVLSSAKVTALYGASGTLSASVSADNRTEFPNGVIVSGNSTFNGELNIAGDLKVKGQAFAAGNSVVGLEAYGDNPSPWFSIDASMVNDDDSRNTMLLIEAIGQYSIHKQVIHANAWWETADVKVVSRYEYQHLNLPIEYGLYGSGMGSRIAIRLNPQAGSAAFAEKLIVHDLRNPSRKVGLSQLPPEATVRLPSRAGGATTAGSEVPYGGWFGYNGQNLYVPARIGVGTSAPSGALHVVPRGANPSIGQIHVGGPSSAGWISFARGNDGSSLGGIGYAGGGNESSEFRITSDGGSGYLRFDTGGGGERLRITSSGDVGIGTSTVGAKLDVNGNIRASGSLTADGLEFRSIMARGGFYQAVGGRKVIFKGLVVPSPTAYATQVGRGLAIMVVDRLSLNIDSHINYDCYGSEAEREAMASALNSLSSDKFIVVTSDDAWRTSPNLKAALLRVGASPAAVETDGRMSYSLIGIPGIGAGNGIEALNEVSQGAPFAVATAGFVRAATETTSLFDLSGRKDSTFIKNDGSYSFPGAVAVTGALTVNGAPVVASSGGSFSGGITVANDNNVTGGLTLGSGGSTDGANLRLLSSAGQPQWNVDNSSGALRFFTETTPGVGGTVAASLTSTKAFRLNDGRLEIVGSGAYIGSFEMVGGGDEVLKISSAPRISLDPLNSGNPHGKFNVTAGGVAINSSTNSATNIINASAALQLEPSATAAGGMWFGHSAKLYTPSPNQLNVQTPEPRLHVIADGTAGPRDAIISAAGAGSGANGGEFQLIASHTVGEYGTGFHTKVAGVRTMSQTNQAVTVAPTTASTSPTTGALVVNGGVGIAGNTNINGNLAVNGLVTKLRVARQGDIDMGNFTASPAP